MACIEARYSSLRLVAGKHDLAQNKQEDCKIIATPFLGLKADDFDMPYRPQKAHLQVSGLVSFDPADSN